MLSFPGKAGGREARWEVARGLLTGIALRLTLLLFWLQMAGTFLVLRPEVSFQRNNPLLLTMTGEFVVKNLVLIAAGLVIGSTVGAGGGKDRADAGFLVPQPG